MLRSLLRDENNQFLVVEDISAISDMVERKERLLWLDLERPSSAEFRMIQEEFNLHPLAIEDAMARHPRPKVDQYENFYLVVFYLVSLGGQANDAAPNGNGIDTTGVLRPGMDGGPEFYSMQSKMGGAPTHLTVGADVQAGPAAGLAHDMSASEPSTSFEQIPTTDLISLRELTLFMGTNYLITVHNSPMPELAEVARRWRQNVALMSPSRAAVAEVATVPGCRVLTQAERANLDKLTSMAPNPLADSSTVTLAGNGSGGPNETVHGTRHAEGRVYRRSARRNGARGRQQGEIGILLYSMLDTIVDNYFPVVDSIVDRVEGLEEEIFERYNQRAIESIFSLKKDLLALRKVLAPERDVLNVLVRRDLPIFDQQTLLYFQDLYDHVVRITDSIDTYRDLLSSALDSYLSMQSNHLNITVKTLTSVSILLMSVAAITGWYGMNFVSMPELSSWWGYPGVMIAVAVVVGIELFYFKRKGWL